jgi:hypothetical protein
MAPQRTKKKKAVWRKKPEAVGVPFRSAIVNDQPRILCDILYVSGLAIKKNIRVE